MLTSDLIVLVDWILDCCACMCPMVVSSDCGLYCSNYLAASSGHKYRKPALMDLVQVDMNGKKRAE